MESVLEIPVDSTRDPKWAASVTGCAPRIHIRGDESGHMDESELCSQAPIKHQGTVCRGRGMVVVAQCQGLVPNPRENCWYSHQPAANGGREKVSLSRSNPHGISYGNSHGSIATPRRKKILDAKSSRRDSSREDRFPKDEAT